MLSIEEKPLVRAAFLLCKKVQVFVEAYGNASIRGAFCAIWENAGKREQFARIMSNVERYKNLYFCDCA